MSLLSYVAALLLSGASAPAPPSAEPVSAVAAAHELGNSYIFLRVYEDSMMVRVDMTTEDVERALNFGWDPEEVTQQQFAARLDSIRAYISARLSMATGGRVLPLEYRGGDLLFLEIADYVVLRYAIEGLEQIPDSVDVEFSVMFDVDRNHRNFLIMQHNWKAGIFNAELIALIFTPRNPEQTLDLASSSVFKGFVGMIRQGVWHIWIGIDHILFLMALVLPSVLVRDGHRWKPAPSFRVAFVKLATIITFFTIAHTITLSLAALDFIRLPSRLVESVIAGSIAIAAMANLMPRLRVPEAAIAFAFGLFHGFGFASVLGNIGIGGEYLVLSLLGFNVGVELGQLAIIVLVFPVLYVLRTSTAYLSILKYGSLLLIAFATYWMIERVFGVDIPAGRWVRRVMPWLPG